MTDEQAEEEKEVEAPVPGAIIAGIEEEVPHDEFDALFPAEDAEDEDGVPFKTPHDEDEEGDDFPFSAELE